MPFWRRNRDQTNEPPPPEVIEPEVVAPDWEPDPSDFDDPAPIEAAPAAIEPEIRASTPEPEPAPAPEPESEPAAGPEAESEPLADPEPRPEAAASVPVEPVEPVAPPAFDPTAFLAVAKPGTIDAGLERSRGGFMSQLRGYLGGADGPAWDEVEETLIAGDVGASLAIEVVERARKRRDPEGPEAAVRAELAALLVHRDLDWEPRSAVEGGPAVVLVVGVNGTGKTTTIGKLATRYAASGRSIILAAADTFRAAAIDQLRIWADRASVPVVAHAPGADPGAVVYDALDAAVARGADLVIADTAGRLHTKSNLMDELTKIRRIVDKRLPGAEPETLFVLDATTGQNGLAQAIAFHEAVGLTGIVLTKLDSTAKGGIVFAIEHALDVPVRFVGVGEQAGDLIVFDPDAFVEALFA